MIVIGVDPGTIKTGYGIVHKDGNRLTCLDSGTIFLDSKKDLSYRLIHLQDILQEKLLTYGPHEAAVEDIFFAKNAKSALKLGHARGVILVTMARRDIPVASYPPALVKRSIVGSGRAEKAQMQKVVQAILKRKEPPLEDEADALAIAICHLNAPKIPSAVPKR